MTAPRAPGLWDLTQDADDLRDELAGLRGRLDSNHEWRPALSDGEALAVRQRIAEARHAIAQATRCVDEAQGRANAEWERAGGRGPA